MDSGNGGPMACTGPITDACERSAMDAAGFFKCTEDLMV